MAKVSTPDRRPPAKGQAPAAPMSPLIPVGLQRTLMQGDEDEPRINVRLYIDASDADGVRFFDEALPVSLVRAILAPQIADFFIPIQGSARMKPPRAKGHFLHTSYIREITLLDELPPEEEH